MTVVMAPISVGELFDKITILNIKLDELSDAKARANVAKELDGLQRIVSEVGIDQQLLSPLIDELRRVNHELWRIEDGKRACEAAQSFDAAFIELARAVYKKNDYRAKIKREINIITGSAILEEKSHAKS